MIKRPMRGGACPVACKLVTIVVAALGCNIPVHLTQSPHILIYRQSFVFCTAQTALRRNLIDAMFNLPPDDAPHAKEAENIVVRGSVYFRIVSVAGDRSAFTIEGHGWHRMYYGMTGDDDASKYLASANYRIIDNGPIHLSELRRASLVLKIIIQNNAYFSQSKDPATVQGKASVFLKIFLLKIAEDVYTLDFNREHLVGVGPPFSLDERGRIQPIGYMKFIPPSDERNLWDFRRTVPIATDYAGMMATRIGPRHGDPDPTTVEWLPESSCQHSRQGSL